MNIKKVVLAGIFSFPEGIAASSRIRNLAYGMLEAVPDVQVVSLYGSEGDNFKPNKENSTFSHTAIMSMPRPKRNKISIFRNRIEMYSKLSQLVDKTIEQLDGSEQEVLLLYGRSYVFLSILFRKLEHKGYQTRTIFDVVEPHRGTTSLLEYFKHPFLLDSTLVFKCLLDKFTTCTYITTALMQRYSKDEEASYMLPGVIINASNTLPSNISTGSVRIGYLGALIAKDYPELLFKCCKELSRVNIDWKLSIIGRFEFFPEGRKWKDKFCSEFSSSHVQFFHNPPDDERDKLLESVDFVVMFRKPEALQEYTFPTRSVEVMAQGKVLVTNTFGEFCKYLIDWNASVVIDDKEIVYSIAQWRTKLSPERYSEMQSASQVLLEQNFNTYRHCKQLLEFVGSK